MANETTSTSIADVIYEEHIPGFLAGFRYGPDLSGMVPWIENVPPGGGTDFRFPRANELAVPAGVKVESTGVFDNVQFTTDHELATSGVVGFTLDVSREAAYDNRAGIPRRALEEALKSMRRRLNQDMLSRVVGASSGVGTDTTECSVDHVAACLAEFETQNPEANEIAIVLHSGRQWADFIADAVTNAASLMPTLAGDVLRATPGFKGMFMNAALFTSPHVAGDSDMLHGCITEMGQERSGLGIAVWQPTQVELEPAGGRYSDKWHVHARFGTCRTGLPLTAIRSRD